MRCIEYCGRQGVALRGHRDDDTETEYEYVLTGNFKALLKLCSESGDTVLQEHLKTCAGNAKYTSKTAQNELLFCIKDFILEHIVTEINTQPHRLYFGIQADEVTDSSNAEQLGIVIRYLIDSEPVEKNLFSVIVLQENI